MPDKASATTEVDEHGRLYLPAQTRKALDIHGQRATVDLDILILSREGDTE